MPYISPQFIETLESKVDIVEVIGRYVNLKKRGSTYMGLSPFTGEKTPSFTVSSSRQLFHCFSSDQGGDVITFLMKHKGLTYPEAIEELAALHDMPVQYDDSKAARAAMEKREAIDELAPLVNFAAGRYHREFLALPSDHPAKVEVFENRGYTEAIVKKWKIGFAPGDKAIYTAMVERGAKEPAKKVGLITDRNDKYFNRLIYPIHDHKGAVIGLAGRDLSGGKTAKWINPVESDIYDKSRVLFGFHEAREHIAKTRTAHLVEGYNDVISAHAYALKNTVGLCGLAISDAQINALRKIADRLVFVLDADAAGVRAAEKYIPVLLAAGFRVEILTEYGGSKDVDDFCRDWHESVGHYGLDVMLAEDGVLRDGFGWLMERTLEEKDTIERGRRIKELCEIIGSVEDEVMADLYTMWLADKSEFTKTKLNKWVKDAKAPAPTAESKREAKQIDWNAWSTAQMYELPDEVDTPIEDLLPTIQKYGMFQACDQIYVLASDEPPYVFRSVSNFTIKIVQHMNDEKFPMKLLWVRNVHGEEKIFDVPSSEINTPQSFDKVLTDQGNYFFKGGRQHLMKLREYLYDQMGTGRKIDVMGQQPEGFWVWQNHVRREDGSKIEVDENGIVKVADVSYYIPSANRIYDNNPFRYVAQKKVRVFPSPVSFETYTAKMIEVHREHAITGNLFTIASMFQDIVVDQAGGGFPIFFLYGPASSGKDQLAQCCQSFFGVPQEAINLEGGVSTIKAQVREFAQFANVISHLSEYHRGDPKLDGVIKGLWDRRGYKRGNIESHVGTDSIPILSSALLTGNDYPDNEALVTRLIPEEMIKNNFDEAAVKRFEELEDMTKRGISSLADEMLRFRPLVKQHFQKKFRMYKQNISEHLPGAHSRMITNISTLGAFYHLLKDEVNFPFDHTTMTDHLVKITQQQMRKLASSGTISRWWDCFLAAMRGNRADRLQVHRDFEIKNGYLYFNFTNAYNRIQVQWFQQYRDNAPGKMKLGDDLKKDPCFHDYKSSERIGESNTSCMVINLRDVAISEELTNAMEWQLNVKTLFDENSNPTDPAQSDLPF